MNRHWSKIIGEVNGKYKVSEIASWGANKQELLKKLQKALDNSVTEGIVKDAAIARAFIDKSDLSPFLDLSEEEKKVRLEKLVAAGRAVNPMIDIRTLSATLNRQILPNHQKIRNCFSIFVFGSLFDQSYLKAADEPAPVAVPPQKPFDKLDQYANTSWWAFHFHYDEKARVGKLGRSTLFIQDKNNVFLQNAETDEDDDTTYEGTLTLENSRQHIYFDLAASSTGEKHIRISVFSGLGKILPLHLGVYNRICSNNSMASGSIVLQRIPYPGEAVFEARYFGFDEARKMGAPPAILKYLEKRNQNYLKTAGNILTLDKLESWLEVQEARSIANKIISKL